MKNIAILGAGGIGAQHAAALLNLPEDWRLSHVCDIYAENARSLGQKTGADTASLDAVLENPDIDVVDICLPPALHVRIALRALAAGKHVVCEKPIAGSIADVDRLRQAERDSGKRVFPVFQYRYGPAFRRLRDLAEAGHLGTPRVATLETHWSRDAGYYAVPWRGTWSHEMGGAILSHAIHIHDLAAQLCGKITSVAALTDTMINPIETEDCAAIAMRTDRGALVTSSITLGAATDESRLRVVFEKATVESARNPYTPGEADWTVTARDPALQEVLDNAVARPGSDGFKGYFADVAAALAGADNRAVTLEDGAASIELVTAIYHSARTGAQVALPLPQIHPMYHGWAPNA
ncbi:Gfo/Idh/MocA family oxidoreductase [Gymnodinialimonas sp. 2305UL16-5]|uniref:Gfo/Idh/MocA family protein n=1 Tax=Gymnodinialimonas mytili TaxID=3126503 RepID=UPI0030AA1324